MPTVTSGAAVPEVEGKGDLEKPWTLKRLIKAIMRGLFMRKKNGSGMEVSHHKVLGFCLFWILVGIWCFGGTHLTQEQLEFLLQEGLPIPSPWGNPPDLMVYIMAGLLGVDVVKTALTPRE